MNSDLTVYIVLSILIVQLTWLFFAIRLPEDGYLREQSMARHPAGKARLTKENGK